MVLKGPTPEDLSKLHTEITQIVNQRYLTMLYAITIFGVIATWLIPKGNQVENEDFPTFIYMGSIILDVIILMIFINHYFLKRVLRTFTTYLIVTKSSNWEVDWETYRRRHHIKYWGYSRIQSFIFVPHREIKPHFRAAYLYQNSSQQNDMVAHPLGNVVKT